MRLTSRLSIVCGFGRGRAPRGVWSRDLIQSKDAMCGASACVCVCVRRTWHIKAH